MLILYLLDLCSEQHGRLQSSQTEIKNVFFVDLKLNKLSLKTARQVVDGR